MKIGNKVAASQIPAEWAGHTLRTVKFQYLNFSETSNVIVSRITLSRFLGIIPSKKFHKKIAHTEDVKYNS